jgi:hypothetical protein
VSGKVEGASGASERPIRLNFTPAPIARAGLFSKKEKNGTLFADVCLRLFAYVCLLTFAEAGYPRSEAALA